MEIFRREYCLCGSVTTRKRRFLYLQLAVQFATEKPQPGNLVDDVELLAKMVNNVDNLYIEIRKQTAELPTAVVVEASKTRIKTQQSHTKAPPEESDAIKRLDLAFSISI